MTEGGGPNGGGGDRAGARQADPGRERWRAGTRSKALDGAPERRERFETSSGIEIRDLYTPADLAGLDEDRDLGRPGEYPFTRGVQPTMYRSRLWTMRQYAGFATAEETNRRFRYLLEQGQTGLSVAFDLPTQMGYDSDAPEAEGEVGPGGRPDREPRRHGGPVRRDPARRGLDVHDDQRHGGNARRPLRRGGRTPGRGPRPAVGHGPERHPQGVHRARDVDLPAATVDAAGDRHLRVRRPRAAALEHDLDQRLPHARGGRIGRPGARVHACRRDRLRRSGRSPGGSRSTTSRPACRSSSPPGPSCSRRSPSSGRRAGCGRESSRTGSGRGARDRWPAASTSRRRAAR